MNNEIVLKPIGVIHTPFKHVEGVPVQPSGALNAQGVIELNTGLEEGLQDIEGFYILFCCTISILLTR